MSCSIIQQMMPQQVSDFLKPFISQSPNLEDNELLQRIETSREDIRQQVTQLEADRQTEKNLYELDKRLQDLKAVFERDLDVILHEYSGKFAGKEELKAAFKLKFDDQMAFLKSELEIIQEFLHAKEELLSKQTKWVEKLQFPESLLTSHPDFVDFVMDSGLGFKIAMFQNSTTRGPDLHQVVSDEDGHPMMRVEGKMERWENIKTRCEFDPNQNKIVSKDTKTQGWNYISPKGLVMKDPFDYERLYSIEHISEEEYLEIYEQAQKYWDTNEEIDPGVEKDCIFQIVTTKRSYLPSFLPDWLSENLEKNFPSHTYMRLIKPNGKVFSFGFEMKHSEQNQVLANLPFTFLMSGITKYSTPDYEEPRQFDVRYETSVPTSLERFGKALDFVSEKNNEGMRFCFGDDNCTKGTIVVADVIGVHIDPTVSIREFFWRLLPDFEKIPSIGPMMIDLTNRIQTISSACYAVLPTQVCGTVEGAASTLSDSVNVLAKRLENLFYNALIYLFGGSTMTKAMLEVEKKAQEGIATVAKATTMFKNGLNFLQDPIDKVYHSAKVREWQLQQPSTIAIPYDKPRLYLHTRKDLEIKV